MFYCHVAKTLWQNGLPSLTTLCKHRNMTTPGIFYFLAAGTALRWLSVIPSRHPPTPHACQFWAGRRRRGAKKASYSFSATGSAIIRVTNPNVWRGHHQPRAFISLSFGFIYQRQLLWRLSVQATNNAAASSASTAKYQHWAVEVKRVHEEESGAGRRTKRRRRLDVAKGVDAGRALAQRGYL
jgi:hypothetical protein